MPHRNTQMPLHLHFSEMIRKIHHTHFFWSNGSLAPVLVNPFRAHIR